MATRFCHICGCTETFGCEEGCWFIDATLRTGADVDVCSVCAGVTPMLKRHYTLTPAGAPNEPIPDNMLGIFTPQGVLVVLAWHIAEAQGVARGLDRLWGQREHQVYETDYLVGSSKAAFKNFTDSWLKQHGYPGLDGRRVTAPARPAAPAAPRWLRGRIAYRPRPSDSAGAPADQP